ncbi:MAG: hypothetical protein R2745_06665 [Vicinamibacterales bacterium]
MGSRRLIGRVMLAAVLAVAGPRAGQGQTEATAVADEPDFSAIVQITRAIVDDSGALVRELPGARYRLARFGGRTRLTMLPPALPGATDGLAGRYAGMTVEGDPSTGRLDVRDDLGRTVALGDPAAGPWAGPAAAAEPLVAAPGAATARRARIEREFGARVGRVRGLDRYLARQGDTVREVLVAPDTALPAELNVVAGRVLVERHTFEYRRLADGGWVRHRTVSAAPVPGQPSQRLVSLTALDDIHATGGAR